MMGRRVVWSLPVVVVLALAMWGGSRALVHLAWHGIGPAPVERLWRSAAPGAIGATAADVPSVSVFLPTRWRSTGTAVVICPGGAYRMLQSGYEGEQIARWLNSFGVAGFVLKYRFAPRYRYPAPQMDAARAMRFVRYHALRFHLDPERIGIAGFSAGGHVASTLLTHFDGGDAGADDPVDRVSSRPDFGILGYPIVSLEAGLTHAESAANLLGPGADPGLVDELSNEKRVTRDTPPTFLFHTGQDMAVPAENSVQFFLALRRAGVPCELHVFETGPHGAGLAYGHGGAPREPTVMEWSKLAEDWLGHRCLKKRVWSYSFLFRI